MATDKKKKRCAFCRKKDKKIEFLNDNLLKICLFIALTDLLHALFFVIQATISLLHEVKLYSILALLGTIFWVLCVILLFVGLWKRRPALVRAWIIFSVFGFIVDIGFIIWGIVSAITVDWDRIKEFIIIFVGIFIESANIYLVYRHYMVMDPCRLVAGKGRQGKRILNPAECEKQKREKKYAKNHPPKAPPKKKAPKKK